MDLEPAAVTKSAGLSQIFKRKTKAHHPPTFSMVIEALKAQNERKGTSVIAIKRYILAKYPAVDPIRLKYLLKKALIKGLDQGHLIRPQNSFALGATGRFKLAPEKPKLKKMSRKTDPVGEKAPKSEKGVKKPKAKVVADKKAGRKDAKGEKLNPVSKKPKAKSTDGQPKAPAKSQSSAQKVVKGAKKPGMKNTAQAGADGTKKAPSKGKRATEADGASKAKTERADKTAASKAKAATGTKQAGKTKEAKGANGPSKAKTASGTKKTITKGKAEGKGPAKGRGKKPEAATGSKAAEEGKASKTGSKLGKKAN